MHALKTTFFEPLATEPLPLPEQLSIREVHETEAERIERQQCEEMDRQMDAMERACDSNGDA